MLIHRVTFDGDATVQKAGKLIAEHFPRVTVGIGMEHTVELIFEKFAKIGVINVLILFAKEVGLFVGFVSFFEICQFLFNDSNILLLFILGESHFWERGAQNFCSLPKDRSEERRVGKECRSRWSPYH